MFGNDSAGMAPGSSGDAAANYAQGKNGAISLFRNSIPSSLEFNSLTTPNPNKRDIIYHELYDSVALTSAAAQSGQLFVTAQANVYNGNLVGANGRLQSNEQFLVTTIRFEVENIDTTNPLDIVDVKEIFRLGTYTVNVSNKTYNSGKLMRFLNPVSTIVLNTKYYSQNPFQSWRLPLPIAIGSNMGFNVGFSVTNPTIDSTSRLFVYLCGFLYRDVQ